MNLIGRGCVGMLEIRKYGNGSYRDFGHNIVKRFRFVYFGQMSGRLVAIVSRRNLGICGNIHVALVDDRKLSMLEVHKRMLMGKPYSKHEKVVRSRFIFSPQDGYSNGKIYSVYEADW